ncbi:MAG: cupin [Acidobacteria bacterium RIFCSPLOWO2_02_FULL_68_18]|nr:MAG: cupin [Acidobacteria bacterium RIFCSPLOWO2_02_FULL_68_18]
MAPQLAMKEALPTDYVEQLTASNALPLWPSLRGILPYGRPVNRTVPHLWHYRELRPLLLRAGELTSIEEAERRVLMLANPGLGGQPFATASIFLGLQLLLPGEVAPNHKHSVAAVRFIIEGRGGLTVVGGERCPMEKGDVILTPPGRWHQHEQVGSDPMVWLDALDAPVVCGIEASYCIEGTRQRIAADSDAVSAQRRAGLVPYNAMGSAASDYPLLRFAWSSTRAALDDLANVTARDEPVQLAYSNPETGHDSMRILGLSALALRAGETSRRVKRSTSHAFLVVAGSGQTEVDGRTIRWEENDVFVAPTHSAIQHQNGSSRERAYLIQIDEAPLHRYLGIYEASGA